jgi:transposase
VRMALKGNPVAMPDKKITIKKSASGTEYVYYTTRAYRNKNGKPTSDEVGIGKKDSATGKLIPNRRYFEIFQETAPPATGTAAVKSVQSCGNISALEDIASQLGLSSILEECFPDAWNRILVCAIYMLCEGNVMMYMGDWFDETRVKLVERMDDTDCSKLFAAITEEERRRFFAEWVKHRGEREYIVYDVSSISTYSENIDFAEWGYNRDDEKLPQINLGMYYGLTTQTPVYYSIYSGSIPDKSYLEFMMTCTQDMGISGICFVMDCGFVTEGNLHRLREVQFDFITALPGSRLEALRLIDGNKNEVRKSKNRIKEYEVYGIKQVIELHGENLVAHIYFDSKKQIFDEKELYARIEKLQTALEKMSGSKRATRKYKDYFVINEKPDDAFSFELDTHKIDEKLDRAGFFILLASNPNLSSNDVLKIYREKDVIEKNFDQFKNRLDFRRMRTHWNSTTEGKLFVGFIALILRAYLLRKIKDGTNTKRLIFDKVLIELRKIKMLTLTDSSEILMPLTKFQKIILAALGVSVDAVAL